VPFRHPDRSHDLVTRIELEVRERLEEAVDYVCLEALVQSRRAAGLSPPAADSADDRRDYTEHVGAFLARLEREIGHDLDAEQRRRLATAAAPQGDEAARLMSVQVALARTLPDYWQRFESVSARYLAGASAADASSRGESPGFLARLFGRG
jgi:hypothetical protein